MPNGGYRQRLGGVELGCGIFGKNGISAHAFGHLAGGNVDSRSASQRADVDSYRFGISAEYIGNAFYTLAAGGAGVQHYDVRRSLSLFEGSTAAESSFDGSSEFGYFEIGTLFNSRGILWSPYLALNAARVQLDPIVETGDADFALSNGGGDEDSLRGIMGLSLERSNQTSWGVATTRIRTGWIHEYVNDYQPFVSGVAAGGSLTDFGVDPGTDWAFVRVQLDLGTLLGGQLTTAYQGQFNGQSNFNSLLAGARWAY